MTIDLLVADDHEVLRRGLARLLQDSVVRVVAEVSRPEEIPVAAREFQPQAVLLDVRLAGGDGLSILGELRAEFPRMAVIILSNHDHPTYIARAVALGAADYLLKGVAREDLLEAIQAAVAGHGPPARSLIHPVREAMRRPAERDQEAHGMSPREAQVLRHLALGLSNREIAASLGVSPDTVKEHVQRTIQKLGVSDRTQAAVLAVRRRLVH